MRIWGNIYLDNPWFLLLLGLIPLYYFWQKRRAPKEATHIIFPALDSIQDQGNFYQLLEKIMKIARLLSLLALIIVLARPITALQEEVIEAEGIDIFLVMDLSSSMLAKDFDPDRLEVSKKVAADFVDKREHDRIGLTVFAGESFTQCPLTTDHRVVKEYLAALQCGFLEDGTAIGMGMASAINRLKDSETNTKVVILLTDGDNNSGTINPLTASEIAKELGVRVYTIGVGTRGEALAPDGRANGKYTFRVVNVKIDEALLTRIANETGGKYYRATSPESLALIYDEINSLEKTKIEVEIIKRKSEEYRPFLFFALALILIEFLLRYLIVRVLP